MESQQILMKFRSDTLLGIKSASMHIEFLRICKDRYVL